MRSWWCLYGDGKNFGDVLTPYLYEYFTGRQLQFVPSIAQAELVGAGSVAHEVPAFYDGLLLGTGSMWPHSHHLPRAQVVALRGRRTESVIGRQAPLLGDIGIVLNTMFTPTYKKDLVVVPHLADKQLVTAYPGADVISLSDHPRVVMEQMRHYNRVVTSSLHGLIAADALGITHKWVPSKEVLGGDWKFQDYASAFDDEIVPDEWRVTHRGKMTERAAALSDALVTVFK
jgi:pyruvyltransferase